MSDLVKVSVRRVHTNNLGTHIEGEEYETTPAHAKLLEDRGIVSIVGEVKAEAAPENQAEAAPANKAGKVSANKSAPAKGK